MKGVKGITLPNPTNGLIPMGVMRYPEGGLGKTRPEVETQDTYQTDPSDPDSDSDGTHVPHTLGHRTQQRAKRREQVEITEAVGAGPASDEENVVALGKEFPVVEAIEGGGHIDKRDAHVRLLSEEVQKLKDDVAAINDVIEQQRRRIEEHEAAL